MERFIEDIQNFRHFEWSQIRSIFGMELAKSTLKMLLKLNIKEKNIVVYEPRLAKLRGGNNFDYGISYFVYTDKKLILDSSCIELDGKFYELWSFWYTHDKVPFDVNCSCISYYDVECIERHYNYLRLEFNKKPNKQRFSIKTR